MPRIALRLAFCLALGLAAATPLFAQRPPRYHLQTESGRRGTGNELADWHATASTPTLDGTPLLEGDRFRSLLDSRLTPLATPPQAVVEMVGGDLLPGRVVGFRRSGSSPFQPEPALLLVEPDLRLQPPQPAEGQPLRVLSDFVRRILWQPSTRPYRPGTVLFRDGRELSFRAVRFADEQIEVLTTAGRQRLDWRDLAELHLPDRGFWPVYAQELARLTPDCSQPLLHVQTIGGLRLTTTLSRLRAHAAGNPKDPSRWFHGLQPAWCLDALWIPHDEIWLRTLLPPDLVPLSRIPPESLLDFDPLRAAPRGWRMDRNIRGGPLRSGGTRFAWGIGVHAESRLAFPLPDMAIGFRTAFGLDRIAGDGGCVSATVALEDSLDQPLYRSPILVGSQRLDDSGELPLPDNRPRRLGDPPRRLVLDVQLAHADRPPGADPLNIRDMADWLEPLLRLDPQRLRETVRGQLPSRFAAWDGWSLVSASDALQGGDAWNDLSPSPGHFLPLIATPDAPLELQRRLLPRSGDQWLVVAAHRTEAGPDVQLRVQINNQPVAETIAPLKDRRNPDYQPLLVPLDRYHDQSEITIQLIQSPSPTPLHWQALAVVDQLPMLYRLFDERAAGPIRPAGDGLPADASQPDTQAGTQAGTQADMQAGRQADAQAGRPAGANGFIVRQDAYSGQHRLEVPPGRAARLELPGVVRIRERPAWGEYRFLRVAVRKSEAGQLALRWLDSGDGHLRSYDWGAGPPVVDKANRIWNGRFDGQWILLTRDLFADFGEFEVQGCEWIAGAGGPAQFDHLYLARHPDDFRHIEQLAELREAAR